MVSNRTFKKFVPEKLKIPKSHFEISFTKDISNRRKTTLEKVAKEGEVVYDTKNGKFYLEHNGESYQIEIKDEQKIPDYMFSRIKIEIPKNLFSVQTPYYNEKFFYFNPFSRTWITPSRQSVPSAYEGKLWGYLADLFGLSLSEFYSSKGRRIREENIHKLSRYLVNRIAHD